MKRQRIQARNMHPYSFRSGEWADITGIFMVTPEPNEPRPCYELQYADFVIDYVPTSSALEFRAYENL